MTTRRLALVTALLLGATALWFGTSGRAAKETDSAAEVATAPAEPEPAPAPQTPEPAAAPRAAAAPAVAANPMPPRRPKKEDNPNAPFAIAGETDEDRAERVKEREDLNRRWQSEAPDATWASESAPRIVKLLADARQSPAALRVLDCRQSICRFELHSAGGTQGEVMSLVHAARQLETETWVHPVEQPDGTWHMETFFPKQGYRLSGGGGRIGQVKQGPDSPGPQSQPHTEEG